MIDDLTTAMTEWTNHLLHWSFLNPAASFFVQSDQSKLSQSILTTAINAIALELQNNPALLTDIQQNFWQDYRHLCQEWLAGKPLTQQDYWPTPDRRLQQDIWDQLSVFRFYKYLYYLTVYHLETFLARLQKHARTAHRYYQNQFFIKQLIDALSPANYWWSNPEILQNTYESHGENLCNALQKIVSDAQNHNLLSYRYCDPAIYRVGNNLAITPGSVVFENELCQLIQYQPQTRQVYQRPLLIIPPWINKYYILDLQQKNSLVKYLIEQGHTVFILSWRNPNSDLAHIDFSDYLDLGPIAALAWIETYFKTPGINILGYCLGGTLLACLTAYLAAHDQSHRVASATFIASLIDFSDPGEIGAFFDEASLPSLAQSMQPHGYLPGATMGAAFNALRSMDLLWNYWLSYYLKQEAPRPFDLLYWNADHTNLPAPMLVFYLNHFYGENALAKGNLTLKDTRLSLTTIEQPQYFLAAKDDHIVLWKSVYQGSLLTSGPKRFVLTASGHIAGIVNPPQAQKYLYWCGAQDSADPDDWLTQATCHPGSWWTNYSAWLAPLGMGKTPLRLRHTTPKTVLEPAPGRYVFAPAC